MRSLVIALALVAFTGAADATTAANPGVQCKSGVPCGSSCIAKGQVCHVTRKGGPNCRGGRTKPCGRTCIPVGRTCRQ